MNRPIAKDRLEAVAHHVNRAYHESRNIFQFYLAVQVFTDSLPETYREALQGRKLIAELWKQGQEKGAPLDAETLITLEKQISTELENVSV